MTLPSAAGAAAGAAAKGSGAAAAGEPLFRFGLLSDLQHADRDDGASFHGAPLGRAGPRACSACQPPRAQVLHRSRPA